LKSKVYLIFYQPYGTGPYKLCCRSTGRSAARRRRIGWRLGTAARTPDVQKCFEWRSVQPGDSSTAPPSSDRGAFSMQGASKLFQAADRGDRGRRPDPLDDDDVHEGATSPGVAKLVRFPESRANKIGMDLSLLWPKAELKTRALGEESFLQRGRDRRGREGRAPDRQLQIPIRHPTDEIVGEKSR